MKTIKKKATLINIIGNIFLLAIKMVVGIYYNSIVILSDAINSFVDIIASVLIFLSVKVSAKSADRNHPYGHTRAEPIAALVVAVLTFALGFEIIRLAFERLLAKMAAEFKLIPLLILLLIMLVKFAMYQYARNIGKKAKSTAILASAVDHKNDIMISAAAIIGFAGPIIGFPLLEPVAAIGIGFWIIYNGLNVATKNLKFLMGEAPSAELLKKVEQAALKVKGVNSVQEVKAHYVGTLIQVEVHIRVNRSMTVYRAHTIGIKVEKEVEKLSDVDRAFVHFDPIIKSRPH